MLELSKMLGECTLFVGNDSGPMHVAAARKVPTVGIFTSTSPAWTAPRGSRVAVAGAPDLFCAPCFLARCLYGLECLDAVGVDEVMAAVERALASVAPARDCST